MAKTCPLSEESKNVVLLLGYVDALIAVLNVSRHFTEQQEYDRVLTVLGKTFGTDELKRLTASGAAMTID